MADGSSSSVLESQGARVFRDSDQALSFIQGRSGQDLEIRPTSYSGVTAEPLPDIPAGGGGSYGSRGSSAPSVPVFEEGRRPTVGLGSATEPTKTLNEPMFPNPLTTKEEADMSREKLLRETLASIQLDPTIQVNVQNVSNVLQQLLKSTDGKLEALRMADGYSFERAKAEQQSAAIQELKDMYRRYIDQQGNQFGPILINGVLENRNAQLQEMILAIARYYFTDDEKAVMKTILDKEFGRMNFSTVEAHQMTSQFIYPPEQLMGISGMSPESYGILQFYDYIRTVEEFYNEIQSIHKHALVRNRVQTDKVNYLKRLVPSVDDTPWEFVEGVERGFKSPVQAPRSFSMYPTSNRIFDPSYVILDTKDPGVVSKYPHVSGAGGMGFRVKTRYEVACDEAMALGYKFTNTNVALSQGLFKVRYTQGFAFPLVRGATNVAYTKAARGGEIKLGQWINTFGETKGDDAKHTWLPMYGYEEVLHPCDARIQLYPLNHFSYQAAQTGVEPFAPFDKTGSRMGVWSESAIGQVVRRQLQPNQMRFVAGPDVSTAGPQLASKGYGAMPKFWVGFSETDGVKQAMINKLPKDVKDRTAVGAAIFTPGPNKRPYEGYEIDSELRFRTMRALKEFGNPIWACPRLCAAANKAGVTVLMSGMISGAINRAVDEVLRTRNWARRVVDYSSMKSEATKIRLGGLTSCEYGKMPAFFDRAGQPLALSRALVKGADGNMYLSAEVDPDQTTCLQQTLAPYVPGITNREQYFHLLRNAGNPAYAASDQELRDLVSKQAASEALKYESPYGSKPGIKDDLRMMMKDLITDIRQEQGLPSQRTVYRPLTDPNKPGLSYDQQRLGFWEGTGYRPLPSGEYATGQASQAPGFGWMGSSAPQGAQGLPPIVKKIDRGALQGPLQEFDIKEMERMYTAEHHPTENKFYVQESTVLKLALKAVVFYFLYAGGKAGSVGAANQVIESRQAAAIDQLIGSNGWRNYFLIDSQGLVVKTSGLPLDTSLVVDGTAARTRDSVEDSFLQPLAGAGYKPTRDQQEIIGYVDKCLGGAKAAKAIQDPKNLLKYIPFLNENPESFLEITGFVPAREWIVNKRTDFKSVQAAVQYFTEQVSVPSFVDLDESAWHRKIWGEIAGHFVCGVERLSNKPTEDALILYSLSVANALQKDYHKLWPEQNTLHEDFDRVILVFLQTFYDPVAQKFREQFVPPAQNKISRYDYQTPHHTWISNNKTPNQYLYSVILATGQASNQQIASAEVQAEVQNQYTDKYAASFIRDPQTASSNITGLGRLEHHFYRDMTRIGITRELAGNYAKIVLSILSSLNPLVNTERIQEFAKASKLVISPAIASVITSLLYDDQIQRLKTNYSRSGVYQRYLVDYLRGSIAISYHAGGLEAEIDDNKALTDQQKLQAKRQLITALWNIDSHVYYLNKQAYLANQKSSASSGSVGTPWWSRSRTQEKVANSLAIASDLKAGRELERKLLELHEAFDPRVYAVIRRGWLVLTNYLRITPPDRRRDADAFQLIDQVVSMDGEDNINRGLFLCKNTTLTALLLGLYYQLTGQPAKRMTVRPNFTDQVDIIDFEAAEFSYYTMASGTKQPAGKRKALQLLFDRYRRAPSKWAAQFFGIGDPSHKETSIGKFAYLVPKIQDVMSKSVIQPVNSFKMQAFSSSFIGGGRAQLSGGFGAPQQQQELKVAEAKLRSPAKQAPIPSGQAAARNISLSDFQLSSTGVKQPLPQVPKVVPVAELKQELKTETKEESKIPIEQRALAPELVEPAAIMRAEMRNTSERSLEKQSVTTKVSKLVGSLGAIAQTSPEQAQQFIKDLTGGRAETSGGDVKLEHKDAAKQAVYAAIKDLLNSTDNLDPTAIELESTDPAYLGLVLKNLEEFNNTLDPGLKAKLLGVLNTIRLLINQKHEQKANKLASEEITKLISEVASYNHIRDLKTAEQKSLELALATDSARVQQLEKAVSDRRYTRASGFIARVASSIDLAQAKEEVTFQLGIATEEVNRLQRSVESWEAIMRTVDKTLIVSSLISLGYSQKTIIDGLKTPAIAKGMNDVVKTAVASPKHDENAVATIAAAAAQYWGKAPQVQAGLMVVQAIDILSGAKKQRELDRVIIERSKKDLEKLRGQQLLLQNAQQHVNKDAILGVLRSMTTNTPLDDALAAAQESKALNKQKLVETSATLNEVATAKASALTKLRAVDVHTDLVTAESKIGDLDSKATAEAVASTTTAKNQKLAVAALLAQEEKAEVQLSAAAAAETKAQVEAAEQEIKTRPKTFALVKGPNSSWNWWKRLAVGGVVVAAVAATATVAWVYGPVVYATGAATVTGAIAAVQKGLKEMGSSLAEIIPNIGKKSIELVKWAWNGTVYQVKTFRCHNSKWIGQLVFTAIQNDPTYLSFNNNNYQIHGGQAFGWGEHTPLLNPDTIIGMFDQADPNIKEYISKACDGEKGYMDAREYKLENIIGDVVLDKLLANAAKAPFLVKKIVSGGFSFNDIEAAWDQKDALITAVARKYTAFQEYFRKSVERGGTFVRSLGSAASSAGDSMGRGGAWVANNMNAFFGSGPGQYAVIRHATATDLALLVPVVVEVEDPVVYVVVDSSYVQSQIESAVRVDRTKARTTAITPEEESKKIINRWEIEKKVRERGQNEYLGFTSEEIRADMNKQAKIRTGEYNREYREALASYRDTKSDQKIRDFASRYIVDPSQLEDYIRDLKGEADQNRFD